MNVYDAVMIVEAATADEETYLEAMQLLVNTAVVWNLQGSFGRAATYLIEEGVIQPPAWVVEDA